MEERTECACTIKTSNIAAWAVCVVLTEDAQCWERHGAESKGVSVSDVCFRSSCTAVQAVWAWLRHRVDLWPRRRLKCCGGLRAWLCRWGEGREPDWAVVYGRPFGGRGGRV